MQNFTRFTLTETRKLSSTPRAKNVGWRLDYFLVSSRLLGRVQDTLIRDKVRKGRKEPEVTAIQVFGSDHCPITMLLKKSS